VDFINLLDFELIAHPGPAFADVRRGNLRLLLAGPNSSAGRPMPDGSKPGPSGWNRIHLIVDDLDTEVSRLRPVPQRRRRGAGNRSCFRTRPATSSSSSNPANQ
jgi:hypothetical protein